MKFLRMTRGKDVGGGTKKEVIYPIHVHLRLPACRQAGSFLFRFLFTSSSRQRSRVRRLRKSAIRNPQSAIRNRQASLRPLF
jgi:hypothetical protein